MESFRTNTIILLFSFCILFTSCTDEDGSDHSNTTITGSGELVTKNLDLGSFAGILLQGQGNITIFKGDTQKITLRAQQNILDIITTQVNNDVLILNNANHNVQTSKGIFLDIVTPDTIKVIDITGAGNVNISGAKQDYINLIISGVGDINAFNLEVDACSINIYGTGNCKVFVNKYLNVSISGVGNVIYKGSPSVTQTVTGVGSVKAEN